MSDPKRNFTEPGKPEYAPWVEGICQCCNMHDAKPDSDFCVGCIDEAQRERDMK